MNSDLEPIPRRTVRLAIVIALWGLALMGTTSWPQKLIFAAVMALIVGTYRRFRVSPKALKQRWTVAFIDLAHQQWKLSRFTRLEVQHEAATGIGEFLLFGPLAFVYGWIVDRFFSWVGGSYQIWLNTEADDRVLAWQGNSQSLFERNLEILKATTGLRVSVR